MIIKSNVTIGVERLFKRVGIQDQFCEDTLFDAKTWI